MPLRLPRKPTFTPAQLERISNILDNLGQIFFGVLVLTPILQGIDKTNTLVLVLGLINVGVCWIGSVILSKGKDTKI